MLGIQCFLAILFDPEKAGDVFGFTVPADLIREHKLQAELHNLQIIVCSPNFAFPRLSCLLVLRPLRHETPHFSWFLRRETS